MAALTPKRSSLLAKLANPPALLLEPDEEENADFWVNAIPEPNTGCWLWIGSMKTNQYGAYGGLYAHRVSYQLHCGEIISGVEVRHKCDTPLCVNPNHLELGSRRDNVMDAVNRKRWAAVKKTHCPYGHEYTSSNTGTDSRGSRFCRICRKKAVDKYNGKRNKTPQS